jgi:hypothetical protein
MRRDHDEYDFLYEGDSITIKAYALTTGESFKAGRYFYNGPSIVWKSEMPHGSDIREEYVDDPSIWAWFQAQLEMKNDFEDKLKELGEDDFVKDSYNDLHDRQDELIEERPSRDDKVDNLSDDQKVEDLVRTRLRESADLLEDLGLSNLADKLMDVNRDLEEGMLE